MAVVVGVDGVQSPESGEIRVRLRHHPGNPRNAGSGVTDLSGKSQNAEDGIVIWTSWAETRARARWNGEERVGESSHKQGPGFQDALITLLAIGAFGLQKEPFALAFLKGEK